MNKRKSLPKREASFYRYPLIRIVLRDFQNEMCSSSYCDSLFSDMQPVT